MNSFIELLFSDITDITDSITLTEILIRFINCFEIIINRLLYFLVHLVLPFV